MRQLQSEALALESKALATSTQQSYTSHVVYWVRFLLVYGLMPFVISPNEAVLCLYVAFLGRSAHYAAVKSYLTGLQSFLASHGFPHRICAWFHVHRMLLGLQRVSPAPLRKLPVTPHILLQLLGVLAVDQVSEVMLFTACLFAFFGFLRKANVCAASATSTHVQRSLLRSDVTLDIRRYCLVLKLRFLKNSQFADESHIVFVAGLPGHPLDPVAWWQRYMALVPTLPSAPAFCLPAPEGQGVAPMVHRWFVDHFKGLLARAGIDPAAYSGHSFRRGAASFSYLVGVGEFMIQHMGAWKSQVYKIYCDLAPPQKLAVHQRWFSAMAQGQLGVDLTGVTV